MGKNRIIKIIMLIVLPIIFLTGCLKWDDVKESVGSDNLSKGVSCEYFGNEKYNGIEKVTFYVNTNGVYISFNNSEKNFIAGPNTSAYNRNTYNTKLTYNSTEYTVSIGFGEAYFNIYKNNNGCPNSIFINSRNNNFSMADNTAPGDPLKHYGYTLKPLEIEGKTCHNQNASKCDNGRIYKDTTIGTIYFEWGYKNDGDKYAWVSEDQSFSSYFVMSESVIGKSLQASTNNGLTTYEIPKNSINDIWFGNNEIISIDKIDTRKSDQDTTTGFLTVYIFSKDNPIGYGNKMDGEVQTTDGQKVGGTDHTPTATIPDSNVDYSNICGNEGVSRVMKIIGLVVYVLKFVAPILIIVFGVIDYAKAVVSSDENALSKATESLIRRLVSGITIFFIPTILWGILNLLDITDGIHDLENNEFGACTRCVLKNDCK